jgi:hypothetical protein
MLFCAARCAGAGRCGRAMAQQDTLAELPPDVASDRLISSSARSRSMPGSSPYGDLPPLHALQYPWLVAWAIALLMHAPPCTEGTPGPSYGGGGPPVHTTRAVARCQRPPRYVRLCAPPAIHAAATLPRRHSHRPPPRLLGAYATVCRPSPEAQSHQRPPFVLELRGPCLPQA